jgi:hypothetical protein
MLPGKAYLQDSKWIVVLSKQPNSEWLNTVNNGKTDGVPVQVEFVDPRRARPKQRSLFFALLGDISKWSGESKEWLKEYFYIRYTVQTAGKEISLADGTSNTVTDATKLIDDVIRFIFEFNVPINEAYPLLPKDENTFQYECIKHRQCLICGRHADIHHMEGIPGNTVGMGNNRNKIDHTQRYLAALCRNHHNEVHKLGTPEFCRRHHLTSIGIKVDAQTLKRIGVRGNYG